MLVTSFFLLRALRLLSFFASLSFILHIHTPTLIKPIRCSAYFNIPCVYVTSLWMDDASWSLRLPSLFSPRFIISLPYIFKYTSPLVLSWPFSLHLTPYSVLATRRSSNSKSHCSHATASISPIVLPWNAYHGWNCYCVAACTAATPRYAE